MIITIINYDAINNNNNNYKNTFFLQIFLLFCSPLLFSYMLELHPGFTLLKISLYLIIILCMICGYINNNNEKKNRFYKFLASSIVVLKEAVFLLAVFVHFWLQHDPGNRRRNKKCQVVQLLIKGNINRL